MMENITIKRVNEMVEAGALKKLHTSLKRGYVSRKSTGVVESYNGRFGKGYAVLSPNRDSTRYCFVTYFVEVR